VVGAEAAKERVGRAYVFTKRVAGWKQSTELRGTDTAPNPLHGGDLFGLSDAISGAIIVVGAAQVADLRGRVYVFQG
jgi:hypothetical protein